MVWLGNSLEVLKEILVEVGHIVAFQPAWKYDVSLLNPYYW